MPFVKDDPRINREGRPKGSTGISITKLVKDELEKVEPKTQKTWGELVIRRILLKATNEGDTQMLKAIWAYIDGMPKQNLESINTNLNTEIEDDDNRTAEEKLKDILDRIKALQED